jgi:hypothetical protein
VTTRITSTSTGGKTTFFVWERCPLSGIYQCLSSHETMEAAETAEAELKGE